MLKGRANERPQRQARQLATSPPYYTKANKLPLMAFAFTAHSKTLAELLEATSTFRVPDYQRSYSWSTKEAGQLIDDVMIACSEARDTAQPEEGYFLGAVLLMEVMGDDGRTPPVPGVTVFDIVDGQQRLITLTILLSVLRDLADDRGLGLGDLITPLIETGLGEASWTFRVMPRGKEGAFLADFVQSAGACLEMPDGENLGEGPSRILDVREHFAETLFNLENEELVRLSQFLVAACHFAVVITRSIDRAHRIFSVLNERGRPLARNDILKAQLLGALAPADRPGASARWTAMEMSLHGSFEELFSHIRTIEGPRGGTIITGIGSVVAQSGGPLSFFSEILEPYARIFSLIRGAGAQSRDLTPTIRRYLSYLAWFGSSEWVPALLAYWRSVDGDAAKLEAFLVRFDRLAFGLRLLGIGADKRSARYAALLQRIRDRTDLDAVDSPLQFSRDEQRNILYNLRGIHARSQLTCKLLLLRLNDELAGISQHLDPSDFTVEHVLPQKPGRNSEWRTWYPLADDRDSATQSLGNLVLVTREQNDRARNMELSKKLEVYFSRGDKVLHITRELENVTEWRKEQIAEREQRLLALVHELWGFTDCKSSSLGTMVTQSRRGRKSRSKAALEG